MKLELSEMGWRLVYAIVLVILWGLLFTDFLLVGLGLAGVGLYCYRYYSLRDDLSLLSSKISFEPSHLDASFLAGSEYIAPLLVSYDGVLRPRLSFPFGELSVSVLRNGKQSITYRFKPSLAADYEFNEVVSTIEDSLGLFKGETKIGFTASFRVYPRVLSVALNSLQYLEGQGIVGAGEQASMTKGRGYEYFDSRVYVEGDDLRQIDWKATARLGTLIIKDYYTEGSGAIHIVYDLCVSDPVSGDVLAAEFLRTVLSFAERGWVIGLTMLDGGNVVSHFPRLYPGFAVSVALRHVLGSRLSEVMSYFDVLDLTYNTRIKKILGDRLPAAGSEFRELVDEMYKQRYGGIVFVTGLVGNPSGLMELSYVARITGTRFVVLEPCTPWRYTDLENAYRIYQQYDNVNRNLLRDGVPVAVNLFEAQEKLGEMEPLYA